MIIWIASYPKSGNTYIRSFIASYYFSKKGKFEFDLLLNILQFPSVKFSKKNIYSEKEASDNWIYNQNQFFAGDKINFIKTHNSIEKFKDNQFTSSDQTLGAIYIVRDPRNVISSLSNHFNLSIEKSVELILDKNKIISNPTDENKNIGLTVLSNWKTHYQSWRDWKSVKVKIIKYEDLIHSPNGTFINILNFLKEFMKVEVNEKKINNVIKSTDFKKLKISEQKYGFRESAAMSNQNKSFFNLGPNNNWEELLDKKVSEKICENFESEMKELGYI